MKYDHIIIDEKDLKLLKTIITNSHKNKNRNYYSAIKRLRKELEFATIISRDAFPDDIVRVNSIVTVQMATNVIRSFQIVPPETSNVIQDKLSILSPIGLALVGCAIDDEISGQFSSTITKLKILKVLQN
ncbi:hypothetical protein B0A65_22375 [Flavobacterium frigidimaris]|uniref:Transcription elongation factor GreA/GreB C-terminal domain-containing protein n=2 Tax=Flavobacterium frigidimaris TaxID=262320 RepID=A0ABX4BJG1_FLAFR|nr:hypothetical protein B0A65_22375 [Flavobacterium frigidimaris]